MFFAGWTYWIHKLNFGTFTGRVNAYNLQLNFEAFDESHRVFTDNDFRDKIILLDFWYTKCGACFQKFPQVQAVYENYKDDPNVVILAVDKPIEEDRPNQAFDMIREIGYTFPAVITTDKELARKIRREILPDDVCDRPQRTDRLQRRYSGSGQDGRRVKREMSVINNC